MSEYGFNSEQEYEEYAQLMWLIHNNKNNMKLTEMII